MAKEVPAPGYETAWRTPLRLMPDEVIAFQCHLILSGDPRQLPQETALTGDQL